MIAGIWIGMMFVVGGFWLIGIHGEEGHALMPSNAYCFLAMYTTKGFPATLTLLIVIVSIMLFQIYAWIAIVLFYVRMKCRQREESVSKGASIALTPSIKSKKSTKLSTKMSALELRLIKKAIGITLTFVLSWVWFVAYIIYELASRRPVPLWVSSQLRKLYNQTTYTFT
jgi:hypothetical protein